MQDSIAQQVSAAIKVDLSGPESASSANHLTSNPDAYRAYLNGKYYWEKRGNRSTNAIRYFQEAIRLDPKFAEPYVGLANSYAIGAQWPEAEALVGKALEIDDSLAEAHATVAFIEMFYHWDWLAAERALDRAIELNPNSAIAYHWKGVYFSTQGRLDEALVQMQRALELDPLSVIITADIGQVYYFGRSTTKPSRTLTEPLHWIVVLK